jgi:hypothetical protein
VVNLETGLSGHCSVNNKSHEHREIYILTIKKVRTRLKLLLISQGTFR